jgi:hypothetical protein
MAPVALPSDMNQTLKDIKQSLDQIKGTLGNIKEDLSAIRKNTTPKTDKAPSDKGANSGLKRQPRISGLDEKERQERFVALHEEWSKRRDAELAAIQRQWAQDREKRVSALVRQRNKDKGEGAANPFGQVVYRKGGG